jgi:hypothetical protein
MVLYVHVYAGAWPYIVCTRIIILLYLQLHNMLHYNIIHSVLQIHSEPKSTYPHSEAVEGYPAFQNYSQEPRQNLHVHVHNQIKILLHIYMYIQCNYKIKSISRS